MLARFEVHGADLPALCRISHAVLKTALLLRVAHREPILDEDDAGANQHALELRTGQHELLILCLGAEAHDPLDAGAVIPTAVEEHHLAGRGQMRYIALEVPLRFLALSRRAQSHYPANAW